MGNGAADKPRTPKKKKRKLHPIVRWLRTAGIASGLLGLGSLVLADWFWPGTTCIYLCFVVLALDVWFEPDFEGKLRWRASLWAIIAILTGGFTLGFVMVDAPMPVSAFMINAEYPEGTVIAGIKWRPEFAEVDFDIPNPTDNPYEDLALTVRPSTPIAAIGQQTSFSDVTFEDKNEIAFHLMDVDLGTGASKAVPLVVVATDTGYKIRCSRMAPHSTIKTVIALADIKWCPQKAIPGTSLLQRVNAPDYIFRTKDDNFGTYWMAHKDADVYALRPTSTESVKVDGTYVAAHRRRYISTKLQIGGNLSISH